MLVLRYYHCEIKKIKYLYHNIKYNCRQNFRPCKILTVIAIDYYTINRPCRILTNHQTPPEKRPINLTVNDFHDHYTVFRHPIKIKWSMANSVGARFPRNANPINQRNRKNKNRNELVPLHRSLEHCTISINYFQKLRTYLHVETMRFIMMLHCVNDFLNISDFCWMDLLILNIL